MGHVDLYNKNQMRDKLFLILFSFKIERVTGEVGYDIGLGGAYGN